MICTFVFQKIIKLGKSMKIIFLILFFSISLIGFTQGVSWTKFEDLKDSIAKEKKPIIVKVETPWCGYCKLMEAKIYSKKRFVKRVGKNYYFVKLNADSTKKALSNMDAALQTLSVRVDANDAESRAAISDIEQVVLEFLNQHLKIKKRLQHGKYDE